MAPKQSLIAFEGIGFAGKVKAVNGKQPEDAVFEEVKAAIAPLLTPVTAPAA